jgi:hypothetical protein
MTTLTIEIPDRETGNVLKYIEEKGGKVVANISVASIKKTQKASFKQGLTEAILISRGEMKGNPLSELWDE